MVAERARKRLRGHWLGPVLGLLLWAWPQFNAPAQSKAYQVKATFLYNFALFSEWPPTAFASTNAPFCIGILGSDPFGAFLDETVRGERIAGHPLVVRRYRRPEEIRDCHVLFVASSEAGQLQPILSGLKSQPVLTVGEMDGFCKAGGIIRFVTDRNNVHFRISLEAAKRANLTLRAKVLRLAKIVPPGGD